MQNLSKMINKKTFFTVICFAVLPAVSFAYDVEVDGIYYDLNSTDKTAMVTTGDMLYRGSVIIPETIIYTDTQYSVTSIGYYAFSDCSGLTSVTIPNSVTSIGISAFYGCSGLTSVTIPNSVTSIGNEAFYGCSGLTSLTIGNSVTSIGNEAFYGCSGLTSLTIPNSVTSIGNKAFFECRGLASLTIGSSVTSIGNEAFKRCSGLTSVTIPNSVTSIGNEAFFECKGLASLTIGNSVTSIGENAFSGCSELTTVIFNAEKCTQMGTNTNPVFKTCTKLSTLTIGKSVTTIPSYAFSCCSGLTSLTIPGSVTSIGESAFSGCSGLTSLTIPNSVTSIGNEAFFECKGLASLTIPGSVTSIGESAFSGCSELTSIVVDEGNTKYDSRNNCNATIETASNTLIFGCKSTIIPNSVTSIGQSAFSGCSELTSVTIPNSVTSIGNSAFGGCSGLTSLTIGNSVTSIGENAFMGCSALAEVDLNSVSNLGDKAFSGCTGLKSVSMLKAKSVNATAFEGCTTIETLMLPYEWTTDFKMDLSGTTQLRTLYIGENTASIPDNIFVNNKLLFDVYSNATTPPSIGTATFGSETYSYATLYVPQGSVDAYKAANGWSKFEDIQELPFQIVVKDKKVSVDRTKSILVSASVTPASSTSSDVKWYSLNDEIATTTTDGVVTGMAEGGVTLLAYCDGITAPMKVIVKKFDGVEDVMADDPTELSEFDVYNLQGIRVRTNCTKEQLSELSHGIYILVSPQGRKKVII